MSSSREEVLRGNRLSVGKNEFEDSDTYIIDAGLSGSSVQNMRLKGSGVRIDLVNQNNLLVAIGQYLQFGSLSIGSTTAAVFHVRVGSSTAGVNTLLPATAFHISGSGGLTISNTSAPSTPANAGAIFVSGGALWYIGSAGTQTPLGAA